jgi:DNA repair protein SbcD/Mre11
MGIRVLHLADLHLGVENYGRPDPLRGYNSRVGDFLRCLDVAVEAAAEVDLVVIAGDVYKTCHPTPTVQREFADRMKRMARLCPVFLLTGNHDVPNAAERATSVDIFSTLEVPGIRVERLWGVHRIETAAGPVMVAGQAFLPESKLKARETFQGLSIDETRAKMEEVLCGNIQGLADQIEREAPDLPAILACHYTVRGAQLGGYAGRSLFMQEIQVPLSVVAQPAFDYVALGHIHQHQELNRGAQPPVVYPGSIERVDFSEEKEPRGFVLADVSPGQTTWRHVPTPSRPFLTIRAALKGEAAPPSAIPVSAETADGEAEEAPLLVAPEPDTTQELLEVVQRHEAAIPGAIVRVVYSLPDGKPPVREAEVRAALKEAQYIAGIARERVLREARERNTRLTTQLTPLEALQEYLSTRPDLRSREADLLEYARPLIQVVSDQRSPLPASNETSD